MRRSCGVAPDRTAAQHALCRAQRVVGVDVDVDAEARERGEADAQRVPAALGGDALAGPQLGEQVQASAEGLELEAHDVGHEQHDQPVTLVRGVARIRAAVGARQPERLECEVAGVVVAPVELVEHGVEEPDELAVGGAPARNVAAHVVEVREQLACHEVLADGVRRGEHGVVGELGGLGARAPGGQFEACDVVM